MTSATTIVISQTQRLVVKMCQPFTLWLTSIPPAEVLRPNHLKKNRKTNRAIAPPPMIQSLRRRVMVAIYRSALLQSYRGFAAESRPTRFARSPGALLGGAGCRSALQRLLPRDRPPGLALVPLGQLQ